MDETKKPITKKLDTDFDEAAAVAFTTFRRPDGFEISLTLRNGSGAKLLEKMDKAITLIKEQGGTPVALRGGGFNKPEVPTKPCPIHQGAVMKEKTMKDGTKIFSHSRGVYPNLEYCNGKGFPSEKQQQAGSNEYEGGEW